MIMTTINEQATEALISTLHELFNAESEKNRNAFIGVINDIRGTMHLTMIDDRYAEKHIWSKFRGDVDLVQTVMSLTTTFIQHFDDISLVVTTLGPKFVPFTVHSKIIDDEVMDKAVDGNVLTDILKANYWLFFLLFTAVNLRVVNQVMQAYIPEQAKGR